MTDQNIPNATDDDRREAYEWAKSVESNLDTWGGRLRAPARVILDAVPAPVPPTLADMTDEERAACRWMQADVKGRDRRPVIVYHYWNDETARVMWPHGFIEEIEWDRITPRPDLRRMEWPADQESAPSPTLPDGWRLADHQRHGRVIVTSPEADDSGEVAFIGPHTSGLGWLSVLWCKPDELTYLDQ